MRLKARPCVTFEFTKGRVTERELRALDAVGDHGSQLYAAKSLGISVPVLHRRLASAEGKVGEPLVVTDNRGTHLTELGEQLLNAYEEYSRRATPTTSPVVACTPVTRQRVHVALSRIERERRRVSVLVSDDETNSRLFVAGQVDLLILDDPQFAYETFRHHDVREVGSDTLLRIDRGRRFARYRYGPQRMGFDQLDQQGERYEVVRFISNVDALLESNLSFFINESMALRKGMMRRSQSIRPVIDFKILGVVHEDSAAKVSGVLKELTRGR